jgi:hypothetical protein
MRLVEYTTVMMCDSNGFLEQKLLGTGFDLVFLPMLKDHQLFAELVFCHSGLDTRDGTGIWVPKDEDSSLLPRSGAF